MFNIHQQPNAAPTQKATPFIEMDKEKQPNPPQQQQQSLIPPPMTSSMWPTVFGGSSSSSTSAWSPAMFAAAAAAHYRMPLMHPQQQQHQQQTAMVYQTLFLNHLHQQQQQHHQLQQHLHAQQQQLQLQQSPSIHLFGDRRSVDLSPTLSDDRQTTIDNGSPSSKKLAFDDDGCITCRLCDTKFDADKLVDHIRFEQNELKNRLFQLPMQQQSSIINRDVVSSSEYLRDVKNRNDIRLRIKANFEKRIQRQKSTPNSEHQSNGDTTPIESPSNTIAMKQGNIVDDGLIVCRGCETACEQLQVSANCGHLRCVKCWNKRLQQCHQQTTSSLNDGNDDHHSSSSSSPKNECNMDVGMSFVMNGNSNTTDDDDKSLSKASAFSPHNNFTCVVCLKPAENLRFVC